MVHVKWMCGPDMSMFLDLKQVDALGSSKPSITILSCNGMSSVSGRAGTVFVHPGSSSYFLDDSGLILSASASSGEMIAEYREQGLA